MVTSLTWISRGPEVGINGLFHPINIDPNFPWHPSTTYFLKVEKRPMLHPFQPMKKKHAIHRKSTLFKGIFQMVLEVFMARIAWLGDLRGQLLHQLLLLACGDLQAGPVENHGSLIGNPTPPSFSGRMKCIEAFLKKNKEWRVKKNI